MMLWHDLCRLISRQTHVWLVSKHDAGMEADRSFTALAVSQQMHAPIANQALPAFVLPCRSVPRRHEGDVGEVTRLWMPHMRSLRERMLRTAVVNTRLVNREAHGVKSPANPSYVQCKGISGICEAVPPVRPRKCSRSLTRTGREQTCYGPVGANVSHEPNLGAHHENVP